MLFRSNIFVPTTWLVESMIIKFLITVVINCLLDNGGPMYHSALNRLYFLIKTDHPMLSHCAEKMIEFYSDKNVLHTNHALEPRPKTACLSGFSVGSSC